MTKAALKEFKATVEAKIKQWGSIYKDEIPPKCQRRSRFPAGS